MYRLPTQFDPRASHADESASAGGSTSTTCSCCVVSLGASAVLTSIYFSSLAKTAGQAPSAAQPEPGPDTPVAEAPVQVPPQPRSRAGWAVMGFFTPVLSLLVGGLFAALGTVIMSPFVAAGVWLMLFVMAHQGNGSTTNRGLTEGVASLIALVVAIAIEIYLWFGGR